MYLRFQFSFKNSGRPGLNKARGKLGSEKRGPLLGEHRETLKLEAEKASKKIIKHGKKVTAGKFTYTSL